MPTTYDYLATHPPETGDLVAAELAALGAAKIVSGAAGVSFSGPLEVGYRACLWCRIANRIVLLAHRFSANDPDALYTGIRHLPWQDHMSVEQTLAVDVIARKSPGFTHRRFASQRAKDGIVDAFRQRTGMRPSVDTKTPDVRVHIQIDGQEARVGIDLSGQSLHRRGYRQRGGPAPLKENVAAALLRRARWPEAFAPEYVLIDPMCGSGTILIEAAWMAKDVAPGLLREKFGFHGWHGHQPAVWDAVLQEARGRQAAGQSVATHLFGYDNDPGAIAASKLHAQAAGVQLHLARQAVRDLAPPAPQRPGLVITNPPYAERLGQVAEVQALYRDFGNVLKERFPGFKAVVLTTDEALGRSLEMSAERRHVLYNGKLRCLALTFSIRAGRSEGRDTARLSEGAQSFANRLEKNRKHFGKWARKSNIACYRVYDADLPEYAFAVDIYEDWVHVQEYKAPASIDEKKAEKRRREALQVISATLDISPEHIFFKTRKVQKGKKQYEKLATHSRGRWVQESGHFFWVNLSDYLDTGLFLDHRLTRALIAAKATGKDFLNLFAYTGTASVYAAKGGARSTTTVDLSNTYLAWAERNFAKNGVALGKNRVLQADCLAWIEQEQCRYDLIFIDPPTFSNSKRMNRTWDVQRDHVSLLRSTGRLLRPSGEIIFSTNARKFELDAASLETEFSVQDISASTIPEDFRRNPKIHRCFALSLR